MSRLFTTGGALLVMLAGFSCKPRASSAPSPQADFAIQAALSTNVLRVGDVAELTLAAAHPAGSRMEPPRLDREREIVVREQRLDSEALPDGRLYSRARYRLTSLALGEHTVSTGEVAFVLADGTRHVEGFPPVTFRVDSVLTNEAAELRDLKGPARWPAPFPWWIAALAAISLLALALGLVTARVLRRPRTILHYPAPEPADTLALRALRRLREKGLIEQGAAEPFYVELTGIARRYLENRFGLRAPERTTEEFIREASVSGLLSATHQALVRDFLEQSDLVKFARFTPGAGEMNAAFASAEKLVLETRPAPAAEGGAS
ncbi:MAG: hypothetical protein KA248_14985 [Kiritimatiellae bacterium]|nr:hypothetical protein [Kiritimatiellia bacterium]